MKPVIGITSYAQDARWGVWHLPAALIPLAYVDAVESAGGRALVVPPARGGDLVQHLPDEVGNDTHKQVPGEFAQHPVEVKEGTRLGAIVGAASDVTSHHHQALGRVGDGLVETAWAADGTLEAVEDPDKRFVLGVQWHPEAADDRALFEALVAEARAYRAARGAR